MLGSLQTPSPSSPVALVASFQFWSLQDHKIAENPYGFSASKQPCSAPFFWCLLLFELTNYLKEKMHSESPERF